MIPHRTLLVSLIGILLGHTTQAQLALGEWNDHLPYRNAVAVAEGGGFAWCASADALFRYSPGSGEIRRLTKVNALSDVGINGLTWNEELGMLLVYYANGNLDLVHGERSYNMSDIKRSNLLGNKNVYHAHCQGTMAYLSCGFGIVVVDLVRREVRDTWLIGPGGSQVRVNGVVFHGDSIYAATATGLLSASRNAGNLASFTNWNKRDDLPEAMVNGPFNAVASLGERLLLNYRAPVDNADTLLVLDADNAFERFGPLYGRRNLALNTSPDGQFVVIPHPGDIHRYTAELQEDLFQYGFDDGFCSPNNAIHASDGRFWVADRELGLVRGAGYDQGSAVVPNGPRNAGAYRLTSGNGVVFVATGAVQGNWTNRFFKFGVHHYADGTWVSNVPENTPLFQGVNDFGGAINDVMAVAVDTKDKTRAFAGSWDEGIIEYKDRVPVTIHNSTNSGLQVETNNGEGKVNIGGLAFDRDGNLWMTNSNTSAPIKVFTANGEWYAFSPGSILNGNFLMSDIVAARNGYKWVIRPRGQGLLVFNDGGTITSTSDDQFKLLNNLAGSGGLPTNDVYAVAEDLEGQVWVGTNRGVAVFYVPEAIFGSGNFDAQQILIEQDGNVQILLETEAVSTIAIDGANRKWIGTETSGVYLISADGRTQLQHFTAENSPLPSNTISSIAIEGNSGEVFIGTDRGIISYRSDATTGGSENACALVYPNPVHENYSGPIAISGLVRDSEVKITDVAGNVVFRTTSLGGQAVWPGTDMAGNRVSTGVYLVLVVDRFGNTKCNTKVLVVR